MSVKFDRNNLPIGIEWSEEKIYKLAEKQNLSFSDAKELMRELVYGGKPPKRYPSWADFWESKK